MNHYFRKAISLCSAVAILSALTIPAFAAGSSAESGVKYVTGSYDGKQYGGSSVIAVEPASIGGSNVTTTVRVAVNATSAIAGYMGAAPRLYSDNDLIFADPWTYNNGTSNKLTASHTTNFVYSSGIVYAQGDFAIYNGNGYDEYSTYQSPKLDVSTIKSRVFPSAPEYGVNAKGQTFGPGCYEFSPDLIRAVGIGGVIGYVSSEELSSVGRRTSPNDLNPYSPSSIPLYAENGTTVIGRFAIGTHQ